MSTRKPNTLVQPYGQRLTAGAVRGLIAGLEDNAPVFLDGGGDYDDSHTISTRAWNDANTPEIL